MEVGNRVTKGQFSYVRIIKWTIPWGIILAALFGVRSLMNNVESQTVVEEPSKIKILNDKELLSVLKNKELRESAPNTLLEAIISAERLESVKSVDNPDSLLSGETIEALVELLDFELEKPKNENLEDVVRGATEFRPLTSYYRYPAIDTLRTVGKPALPYLVKSFEDGTPNSVMELNLLFVIKENFRLDDVGLVDFLRAQAAASHSSAGKARLLDLAEKILNAK